MRLNAWLARAGVASRRKADELIKAGRVTVNGAPGQLNTFVRGDDDVRLDGERLVAQRLAYVLLNKPVGVVTTAHDPQGRPTVVALVEHAARVVPVGRLDVDTTGALLLTNDGELAHRLAHPRYEVDKVYEVETWKPTSDDQLGALREGVELDDGPTRPADVRRLDINRFELTIHEGRNRQVRRMVEAVGHRVKHLHRSRYGPLTLEGLEPGAWRELEPSEVELLRVTTQRAPRPGRAGSAPERSTTSPPARSAPGRRTPQR
jgi:pseudouridine synthase